jgi:hypothetical protein
MTVQHKYGLPVGFAALQEKFPVTPYRSVALETPKYRTPDGERFLALSVPGSRNLSWCKL